MTEMPGGPLATRPLHFVWMLDCSGSMTGDKIQSLNFAIRESIPAMQSAANENPNAQVLVRAVTFSDGAQWHVAQATPVADFRWSDVTAGGLTDMGLALSLVAEQLRMPPMTDRALPPVLVLVSDGQPTDDFASGLGALMSEPWGKKAVRIAIAVGTDADRDILQDFIANPQIQPLQAGSAAALVEYIRWASTAVVKAASAPPSERAMGDAGAGGPALDVSGPAANVPIPAPPEAVSADDVW